MYRYSERVTAVRPVALASRTMRHTSVSFTFTIALRVDDHSYTHNGTGMQGPEKTDQSAWAHTRVQSRA